MSGKNFSVRFREKSLEKMEDRLKRLRVSRSLYLEICHDIIDNYYDDTQLKTEIKLFEMDRYKRSK